MADIVRDSLTRIGICIPVRETGTRSLQQVAVGQTGKILIRGPQVMSGYQNNPEATAAVIDKDGYFDTGALRIVVLLLYFFLFDLVFCVVPDACRHRQTSKL